MDEWLLEKKTGIYVPWQYVRENWVIQFWFVYVYSINICRSDNKINSKSGGIHCENNVCIKDQYRSHRCSIICLNERTKRWGSG